MQQLGHGYTVGKGVSGRTLKLRVLIPELTPLTSNLCHLWTMMNLLGHKNFSLYLIGRDSQCMLPIPDPAICGSTSHPGDSNDQ